MFSKKHISRTCKKGDMGKQLKNVENINET